MNLYFDIINLDSVNSTNDYAKIFISKNSNYIKDKIIIISTKNQTNGRGQKNNIWVSEPNKNVTISIIIKNPPVESSNVFILSKITSLAIIKTLQILEPYNQINIKWPNDILLNKKKIAGILIENFFSNNIISYSIIGIGINVNQTTFPDFKLKPTSLKLETTKEYDIETIINNLLENFLQYYNQIKLSNKIIDDKYLNYLYGIYKELSFIYNNKVISAKIVNVDNFGKLILKVENSIISANFKEIEFLF